MGKLTGRELAAMEEHLLICEECQLRVEEVDDLINVLRRSL